MRTAPAVSVQAGRSAGWRAFQALLAALSVAALGAWVLGHLQQPSWPALMLAPLVAAWAWHAGRQSPVTLVWDGQAWTANGEAGALEVMIDLGGWLLLRLWPGEARRQARWIAVSRVDAGPAFHALRAAVYCRAYEPTPGLRPASDGSHVAPPA